MLTGSAGGSTAPFTSLLRLLWRLPCAYVDPTSGGILLQLLLGGSATYLVLRGLVKALLSRRFRRRPEADKEEAQEGPQP